MRNTFEAGTKVAVNPQLMEALRKIDESVGEGPFTVNRLVWVTSCTCGAAGRQVRSHSKNCPMCKTGAKREPNLEVVEVETAGGSRLFAKESLLPAR